MDRKTVLSVTRYAVARVTIGLIRALPSTIARGLFRMLALVAWAALAYHRKAAAVQMRAALGVHNTSRSTRRVFMNQADILVDTIRYAYMDDSRVRERIRIEGLDHLNEARSTGKGIMMITGHIGNWEILSHLPRILGVDFCVMAHRRRDKRLESLVDEIRSRSGATILPPTGKALMLVRELKRGRTIGMVVDGRHDGKDAVWCDVFGMQAPTNPAPAFIAIKGDAVVLPVAAVMENGSYRIVFSKPVQACQFGSGREAVESLSRWMQSWVVRTVQEHPTQWFWLYSRWIPRGVMRRVVRDGLDLPSQIAPSSVPQASSGSATTGDEPL